MGNFSQIITKKKKVPAPFSAYMSNEMDDTNEENQPPDDELEIEDNSGEEQDEDQPTSRLYAKKNANPDLSSLRDLIIHAPNLEDSRPSVGRNIANALVAGATAFSTKNPVKGLEIGQQLNDEVGARKAEQFKQDLGARKVLTEMGDTGANLAQKDVAEQGAEDISQRNDETKRLQLEQRGKEFAGRLGLDYDKLSETQKKDLEQINRWHAQTSNEQANIGLRGKEVGLKERELNEGKPVLKDILDNDPNSPGFGTPSLKAVNSKNPGNIRTKLTGQEQTKFDSINGVLEGTNRLNSMLDDPDVVKDIGAAAGRGQNLLEALGTSANPKTQEFAGMLKLLADTHAGVLSARGGQQLFQHLEHSLARINQDPEMVRANLKAMAKNAVDMGEGILPGFKQHSASNPLLAEGGGGQDFQVMTSPSTGRKFKKYKDGRLEEIK